MIYRDLAGHLVADTVEELHAFAARAGINRCWFDADTRSRGERKPHYDIPKYVLRESSLLLSMETKLVESREILRMSKLMAKRSKNVSQEKAKEDSEALRVGLEAFSRLRARSEDDAEEIRPGLLLKFITGLIMKEIPGASRARAESAARQIMYQLNIKEAELIGS